VFLFFGLVKRLDVGCDPKAYAFDSEIIVKIESLFVQERTVTFASAKGDGRVTEI
jgi:hypothetical protein